MMRQEFSATSPQFRFFANTGLTANTAFTPTEIAKLDATGFDLPTGHTYKVNGVNIMAAGTWLPVNNPQFTGNLITGPAYGLSDHDGTVNVRPLIFRDDAERFRLDDTLFPNNIIAFDASVTPATSARLMQNGTIGATNTIGSDDLMIARRMSFLEAAPGTGGLILINYLHTGEINTHGTGDITNQFGNIVALGGRVQAGYSRMGHINAPVAGYVAAFADHDQTNWIARGTSASILIQDMAPGNIPRFRFTSNTGTTIGAAFTPTQIAQIDPTGMNLPTGANYLVNGTNDWIDGGTY
jgi:hypothetical protein